METGTIRAFLLTGLIITAMILGVLFAPKSHATTEQDYQYFSLLENNGMHIKSPKIAKDVAYAICDELAAGRNWRLIMTELMDGGDWDIDTAATVFAAAVTVYCPSLDPSVGHQMDESVA